MYLTSDNTMFTLIFCQRENQIKHIYRCTYLDSFIDLYYSPQLYSFRKGGKETTQTFAIASHCMVLHYTVMSFYFCSTWKSVTYTEVNPNPSNAPGKTFKNVNCYSKVDLLIIFLSRISV